MRKHTATMIAQGMKPTKDWEIKRKAVEQRYGITVEIA
jgi:hypothetical protein